LGEEKDFLDPAGTGEISKEAFAASEEDDKLNRPARQSFSFPNFQPFAPNAQSRLSTESGGTVGISFQRIRMGPEESSEPQLQQRQPPSIQNTLFRPTNSRNQPNRARPRLTLNDLDFQGFEFNQPFTAPSTILRPTQAPSVSTRRSRFENFQTFQTATQPTRQRNVQPTLASNQIARSQFPNFQNNQVLTESPRSRFSNFNLPVNSDPRRRNRNQLSRVEDTKRFQSKEAPTFTTRTEATKQFESNEPTVSSIRTFPPNSVHGGSSSSEKTSNRSRMRKRLKIATRPPVTIVTPDQFTQNTDFISSTTDFPSSLAFQTQNTIKESVRSFENKEALIDDYEDDLLIQNCLKEAEKHAKEIEELENRTALHIDYAQEKQLEIQNLEINLGTLKNKSKTDVEKISNLENNITNLTALIETKDKSIASFKDDVRKLEETIEDAEVKNTNIIEELNAKLNNMTIELANTKISLDKTSQENVAKSDQIDDAMVKIEKLKKEKKNLLRIVQQLAEISNPSLNFNKFSIGSPQGEYDDYEEELEDYETGDNIAEDEYIDDEYVEDEYVEDNTSEPDGSGDLADV